jgi:integrase/recombinase XerC
MTQHNNFTANMTASTPADVHQLWLGFLQRQGKSLHTLNAYQHALAHFARWYQTTYGAEFGPHEVMPRDVRDWKAYQQTVEQAAPATVNQRLVALTRFFRWARSEGLCRENPAEEVGNIRLAPRQPKALTNVHLRRLLRAARGDVRDYAMLELLVGTGLRVGELLALKVGDVEVSERSGKVTVRRGKHENFREIPLTLDVRKALTSYLDEVHPDKSNRQASLWMGPRGPLTHRSSVTRLLERYALQAGIEPVNPHTLRHTFATRYLNANPSDLRGLARLLGHTSLDTVMIYTEPTMQDLTERMERVDVANLPAEV